MSKVGVFIGIVAGSAASYFVSDTPLINLVLLGIVIAVAAIVAPIRWL